MGRTDGNQTFGGSVPVCSSGVLHSVFAKSLSYSEERKPKSLFTTMKRLLGFCRRDRLKHLVKREIITRFVFQVQILVPKDESTGLSFSLLLLLVLIFTTGVNAFRFEVGDLFLLQIEFGKYRSVYVSLGYLLAFSANIVTHFCSCKNRTPEHFAGFSRLFSICFFSIYSYEVGDLLPY